MYPKPNPAHLFYHQTNCWTNSHSVKFLFFNHCHCCLDELSSDGSEGGARHGPLSCQGRLPTASDGTSSTAGVQQGNAAFLCRISTSTAGLSSLVPRLSLSHPLNFADANITCMCEELEERESLVWNHTHPWPFSIEFLLNYIQPRRPQVGAVPYQALSLLQFFAHTIRTGKD